MQTGKNRQLISKILKSRQLRKGCIAFVISFCFIGIFSQHAELIYSKTNSLPQNFFIRLKHVPPRKGDLTCTYNSRYGGRVIKKIIGTEEDHVWYDKRGQLWVNDYQVGSSHSQTESRIELKSIAEQIIPKDHVFLYAPHPQSFDSRYEDVGLVPINQLQGKIIAIW